MKKFLNKIYKKSRDLNDQYIVESIKRVGPCQSILDVGCWDGDLTLKYKKACNAQETYGIEIDKEKSEEAKSKGIKSFNLVADKDNWPISNGSLDCVVSNQVIEHLTDVDHFFNEASRVLKPGGYLVTSTNNLSSLHNIGALIFGWTPFDLSNSSKVRLGLGNPLSYFRGENTESEFFLHKCVYTPKWLFEWQEIYGLKKVKHMGAGLYPFPSVLGNIFKTHAAFMVLTTQKSFDKKYE